MEHKRDTIEITGLSSGGEGVGRSSDGRVLFVPLTAPGDKVEVRVERQFKRHGHAVLEAFVEAADSRITPRCQLFGSCGGCDWQHLPYPEQLAWKRDILTQTLRRVGKIELDETPDVLGAALAYGSRTRARMPVQEGSPGFYKRASNEWVEVRECPVLSTSLNEALAGLTVHLSQLALPVGEVRLLSVGDDVILSFHMPPEGPKPKRPRQVLSEWVEAAAPQIPGLKGAVLWRNEQRLATWGEPSLREGEPPILYRAEGFAQASFAQNRVLVEQVLSMLAPFAQSRLVEVYAGRGNLTLPLAQEGRSILALDVDTQAIADGRQMAKELGFEGVVFRVFHDEKQHLREVCERENIWPQCLLLDPPSRGLSRRIRKQILTLRPPHILYVSCDVATLARDLRVFLDDGYEIQEVRAVDLMPQTAHLETLVLLKST